MKKKQAALRAACALGACMGFLAARAALAGPAAYVHTPIVEYGEREFELKWGDAKQGDGTHERQAVIGVGSGVTPWWFTELNVGFEGETGTSTKYEAVEWENVFQLTETGKHAVDAGLLLEIERPRDHAEGWEVTFGPLLQSEVGRVQLNGNVLFERHFDAAEPGETELLYEWQVKYRWHPRLEFGLQGFGELGKWDHWAAGSDQSHILGPAIFGRFALGAHHALRYDAGYLFAASPAAPDRTLRVRLEYEF
jgi:hypothetical protein